ncbi:hypothetical protein D3C87_2001960 [compost metagenome]
MAMIAQRQWSGQRAGQGGKTPEMGEPVIVAEPAQSDPLGPAPVTMAQHSLGEIGRFDLIEKIAAEGLVGGGGLELGHGGQR